MKPILKKVSTLLLVTLLTIQCLTPTFAQEVAPEQKEASASSFETPLPAEETPTPSPSPEDEAPTAIPEADPTVTPEPTQAPAEETPVPAAEPTPQTAVPGKAPVKAPRMDVDQTGNGDIVRSLQITYKDENGIDQPLTNGQTIDPAKITEFHAEYAFKLNDNLDANDQPHRTMNEGDYYLVSLPDKLTVMGTTGGDILNEFSDIIATFEIIPGSPAQLKVTFTDFIDKPGELEIYGRLEFDFELDSSGLKPGESDQIKIPIDNNNNIIINVEKPEPPPTTPVAIEKKVKSYDPATGRLVWSIDIFNHDKDGGSTQVGGKYEGWTLTDTIDTTMCAMESVTHKDVLDPGDYSYNEFGGVGTLEYTVPPGRDGADYATIEVAVIVDTSVYNYDNTSDISTIENTATFEDTSSQDPVPPLTDTAEKEIKREWLSKKGELYQGNQLKWTITANAHQLTMYNATIIDYLDPNLELDKDSVYMAGKGKIEVYAPGYSPSSDTEIYAILTPGTDPVNDPQQLEIFLERDEANASSEKREITLVTKPPKNGATAGSYTNTVDMTTRYKTGNGDGYTKIPGISAGIGVAVPDVNVTKEGSFSDIKDLSAGTITWTIKPASNATIYGKSTVVDVIPADQSFVSVSHEGNELTANDTEDVYYKLTANADKTTTVTITFNLEEALETQQTLTLVTKIDPEIYSTNLSNKTFKNKVTANLYDSVNPDQLIASDDDSADVSVTNTLIKKSLTTFSQYGSQGEHPKYTFTITVNGNKMPLKDVVVKDYLDEIKTQFQLTGESWKDIPNVKWTYAANSAVVKKNGSDDVTAGVNVNYNAANNILTVDFGAGVEITDSYTITFQAELDPGQDPILQKNGSVRCKNNAADIGSTSWLHAPVVTKITSTGTAITNTVLGKTGAQSDDNKQDRQILWTIHLNQHKTNLRNTTVTDLLAAGMALDPTSIRLYTDVISNKGAFLSNSELVSKATLIDESQYTYRYGPSAAPGEEGRNLFELDLPNHETAYVLQFATDLDKSLLGTSISNEAYLKGNSPDQENRSISNFKASNNAGGGSTRKAVITVNKKSKESGAPVNGAEFTLHWLDRGNPVFVRTLSSSNEGAGDGAATFYGLTIGQKYTIAETKAPDGYKLDDSAPREFTATNPPAADLADLLTFSNTPVKTGSWTPEALKELNKSLNHSFSFILADDGGSTVMTGASQTAADTKAPIDFTLAPGVDGKGLITFEDDYTFDPADPVGTEHIAFTKNFTLYEEDPKLPGYEHDTTVHKLTVTGTNVKGTDDLRVVVTDKDGNVLSDNAGKFLTDKAPLFTNSYSAVGSLTLSAAKYLEGATLAADAFSFALYEGTDPTDPAKLLQTVKNAAGQQDGTRYKGAVSFAAIDYTYDDVGTHTYTIVEKQIPKTGYTLDAAVFTVTVDVRDNDNGTVTAAVTKYEKTAGGNTTEAASVEFTNTYVAADATLAFTGTKTLDGSTLTDGQFSFTLQEVDADGNALAYSEEVTNTADGTFAFADLTYQQGDIGKIFHYTLAEKDDAQPGYTYDAAVYNIDVAVADNGDGTLRLTTTIKAGGTEVTDITFANTYEAAGTLGLSAAKALTGTVLKDQHFTFNLQEVERDGTTVVPGGFSTTAQNALDGTITFEDITYEAQDAGKTFYYAVSEKNDGIGGYAYDSTVYIVKAEVTDNGDGTLHVSSSLTNPAGSSAMRFNNTYTTSDITESFAAKKELEGRALEAGQFSFTLQEVDADGKALAYSEEKSNAADGTVTFSDITYKQADIGKVFYYSLKEKDDKKPGYTYDGAEFLFTVKVTDNGDGTLKTEKTVTKGGTAAEALFKNSYHTTAAAVTIEGRKELTGQAIAKGQFQFTLTDESGRLLETVFNDEQGRFAFTELRYELKNQGEYMYTIGELKGSTPGMVYDGTVYTLKVSVTDNGDGSLKAVSRITAPENSSSLIFRNSYSAPAPTPTSTPTPAATASPNAASTPKPGPTTGDTDGQTIPLLICLGSAAAICALVSVRKKKYKK